MNPRGLRRYVDDLLRGRRPKPFQPDDFEAAQIKTAIDLRAARLGNDTPSPEFLADLRRRLAEQAGRADAEPVSRAPSSPGRRQMIVGASAAAAAAAAGAVAADRLVLSRQPAVPEAQSAGGDMVPSNGSWQYVAASSEVPEGGVRPFDVGSVSGFVRRVNGSLEAVSGVCTHQGCRLWFDGPADRLRCPCHSTSFSTEGQVLTHQLPIAPKPLPHFQIREVDGIVEVLAPDKPPTAPS